MSMRTLLGMTLIPLVLIIAAGLVAHQHLWGALSNLALPWLLTAIAIAMLILGGTCAILQCDPADIPLRASVRVTAAVLLIFGIALIVDAFTYSYAARAEQGGSAAEWLGFAVILAGVFALPHARPRS